MATYENKLPFLIASDDDESSAQNPKTKQVY